MSEPDKPRLALAPAMALAWSLLLTVALSAASLVAMRLLGASRYTILALALVEVALYVTASAFVARLYVAGPRSEGLALRPASPLQLLLGASLGVVLHLPAGYLDALVEKRFPTPRARLLEQLAQLTPTSSLHAACLVLGIALLAPLAEELFFRGALFTALARKAAMLGAVVTTSLAFVLAHQEPRMWAPLLLVALVLAELRRASGSIWPGFALHAVFNATTLASVFATRPSELTAPTISWVLGSAGTLLTLAGIWVFGRVSMKRTQWVSQP
jgi:membrane protease YdiL (CAAX protease family)